MRCLLICAAGQQAERTQIHKVATPCRQQVACADVATTLHYGLAADLWPFQSRAGSSRLIGIQQLAAHGSLIE